MCVAWDTGQAQQLSLFSQIQLSLSLSQGASFHKPVRNIMTQFSRPRESLGSPTFQWLQWFGGAVAGGAMLRIALGSSLRGLACLLLGPNLDSLRV